MGQYVYKQINRNPSEQTENRLKKVNVAVASYRTKTYSGTRLVSQRRGEKCGAEKSINKYGRRLIYYSKAVNVIYYISSLKKICINGLAYTD